MPPRNGRQNGSRRVELTRARSSHRKEDDAVASSDFLLQGQRMSPPCELPYMTYDPLGGVYRPQHSTGPSWGGVTPGWCDNGEPLIGVDQRWRPGL